jgi:MFS family permease
VAFLLLAGDFLPALAGPLGGTLAGQVFQPASRAAVPAVVPERDLERANAAVGVATNGGETLGPLVAALLLPVLDVRGVLLVDAAAFLASAVLLGLLPALPGATPDGGRRPSFLADATGVTALAPAAPRAPHRDLLRNLPPSEHKAYIQRRRCTGSGGGGWACVVRARPSRQRSCWR